MNTFPAEPPVFGAIANAVIFPLAESDELSVQVIQDEPAVSVNLPASPKLKFPE